MAAAAGMDDVPLLAGIAADSFLKAAMDRQKYKRIFAWKGPPVIGPKGTPIQRGYSPRYSSASLNVCGTTMACSTNLYEAWWAQSAAVLAREYEAAVVMCVQLFCWRNATSKYLSLHKAAKAGYDREGAAYVCFKSLIAIRRSDSLNRAGGRRPRIRSRFVRRPTTYRRRSFGGARRSFSRRGGFRRRY